MKRYFSDKTELEDFLEQTRMNITRASFIQKLLMKKRQTMIITVCNMNHNVLDVVSR